ncbi:MAG: MFS transporter [Vicinamibacterales bacterium]|nr:MFS transporter [Vicinamibacterales bacterium]
MLGLVALAQWLGMTLWFSATAVTPRLVAEWTLSPSQASWLTLAVQAGFVAGTLASALTNLADLINPRRLVFLGCLVGAAANAAVLATDTPAVAIGLRLLTGAALACVYPPGMKIAAGWFLERRGFALGILIGALTIGKAFPYLLTAIFGADWQTPMLIASALAVAGGTLVLAAVEDGPHVSATSPFDPRAVWAVFASRGARLATFGYLGHMWELYAMWAWVGVLATASLTASGVAGAETVGAVAAFLAIGSGAAGCVSAGWLADRVGRARVAMWALATSASCAAAMSLAYGGRPGWLYVLLAVWGFAVVADSAQFSALVSEHAPRDHVGTALTMQVCLGFLLTLVTIEALPRVAGVVGWQHASWLLVPGPVLGWLAMRGLRRPAPSRVS